MSRQKIRIAVVGLHFGAEFVPIYQRHPDVDEVVLCDLDSRRLREVGDRFGIAGRFSDLGALLGTPDIDAVHLLTPFLLHAAQTLQVLEAGKHCASAVCMGSTLDELRSVVAMQRSSGKNYMMMETVVYSREFLFVKDLYDRGELGDLTFLRGVYFGSKKSFEWNQLRDEKPALFTLSDQVTPYGRPVSIERITLPDYADRLPESIQEFTRYEHDGAHGGSHPHLAHEFVRSVVEERPPAIDAVTAANWTAPGICAHESALREGATIPIPTFS